MYFHKIPSVLQRLLKRYVWRLPTNDYNPTVYLTFDDGPHPEITPWVLEQLEKYEAKATFFCIGKNVIEYPNIYQQILASGHKVGNHTHNHLKGRKVKTDTYIANVEQAQNFINSKLFRPPYGSLKRNQAKVLEEKGFKIILWTIIPGDWDKDISPEKCLENVVFNIQSGDILVLHDSEKAQRNMQYVLPRFLEFCKQKGWSLELIDS